MSFSDVPGVGSAARSPGSDVGGSEPPESGPDDPFDGALLHEREMVRRLARVLQEIWSIEVQRCLALSMGLDVIPEQLDQAMERQTSAERSLVRAEARLRQLDARISRKAPAPWHGAPGPN